MTSWIIGVNSYSQILVSLLLFQSELLEQSSKLTIILLIILFQGQAVHGWGGGALSNLV